MVAGEVAAARRYCEEALELSQRYGYAVPMVWVAAAQATLEPSRVDAETAWQACELLTSGLEYAGIREPTTVFFLPHAQTRRSQRTRSISSLPTLAHPSFDQRAAISPAGGTRRLLQAWSSQTAAPWP
jgi:hypothetical protein